MSNERIDLTQFEDYNAWDFYQDKILATEPNLGIMMLALIAELKRCYRVIEDIESMIPDNHEEIDPVLSDILSECHRLLGM